MRIALLSDIHANLPALRACLAHARAQGADRLAFLGDLVGYGAQPVEVVEMIMELATEGAIVLQGNHDEMAASDGPLPDTRGSQSAGWTRTRLEAHQREFLAQLPLVARIEDNLLVHASADQPARWHYVTHPVRASRSLEAARQQTGICRVFGGHVHDQKLWYAGRRGEMMSFAPTPGVPIALPAHRHWLATIGSVGQPRDGDPRAGYALLELAPATRVTFLRVPYDHAGAACAIARAGLPADDAARLMEGR